MMPSYAADIGSIRHDSPPPSGSPRSAPRTAVYFVAYTKSHGVIEVISIRFADAQECAIFFAWPPGSPCLGKAGRLAGSPNAAEAVAGSRCPGSARLDRERHAREQNQLWPGRAEALAETAPGLQARILRKCAGSRARASASEEGCRVTAFSLSASLASTRRLPAFCSAA